MAGLPKQAALYIELLCTGHCIVFKDTKVSMSQDLLITYKLAHLIKYSYGQRTSWKGYGGKFGSSPIMVWS